MVSPVRYEPWGLLNQLYSELDRAMDPRRRQGEGDDEANVVTGQWVPAVDIREENDRFVIHADIPGVDPKDIEVTMDNGALTIRGERTYSKEEDEENFRRVERMRGSFYRRFTLPDSADPEGISAKGNNGVLEIVIPKTDRVKARRIQVES